MMATMARSMDQIDQLASGQATMIATDRMFLYSAIVLLLTSGLIWMIPRPKQPISAASH